MLKSALGINKAQFGFSLLEMLIVLLIIGIATSMTTVYLFTSQDKKDLQKDAQRLAELFNIAQLQSRASQQIINWSYNQRGFSFHPQARKLELPWRMAAQRLVIRDNDLIPSLRSRDWLSKDPVIVNVVPENDVTFSGEWLYPSLQISLSSNDNTIKIRRLLNGQFRVVQ